MTWKTLLQKPLFLSIIYWFLFVFSGASILLIFPAQDSGSLLEKWMGEDAASAIRPILLILSLIGGIITLPILLLMRVMYELTKSFDFDHRLYFATLSALAFFPAYLQARVTLSIAKLYKKDKLRRV